VWRNFAPPSVEGRALRLFAYYDLVRTDWNLHGGSTVKDQLRELVAGLEEIEPELTERTAHALKNV